MNTENTNRLKEFVPHMSDDERNRFRTVTQFKEELEALQQKSRDLLGQGFQTEEIWQYAKLQVDAINIVYNKWLFVLEQRKAKAEHEAKLAAAKDAQTKADLEAKARADAEQHEKDLAHWQRMQSSHEHRASSKKGQMSNKERLKLAGEATGQLQEARTIVAEIAEEDSAARPIMEAVDLAIAGVGVACEDLK